MSASDRPAVATSVLAAQFWLLGPAGFAPFVLFGVEWVDPAFIEDGALHLFFVGWALPISLAGLVLFARTRPGRRGVDDLDMSDVLPADAVPTALSKPAILAWNLAILLVAVGFFYQDRAWSVWAFGPGYTVILALWGSLLLAVFRVRYAHSGGGATHPPTAAER